MGKIFGISDNPVSTIESALKGYNSVEPPFPREILKSQEVPTDRFIRSGKKNICWASWGIYILPKQPC